MSSKLSSKFRFIVTFDHHVSLLWVHATLVLYCGVYVFQNGFYSNEAYVLRYSFGLDSRMFGFFDVIMKIKRNLSFTCARHGVPFIYRIYGTFTCAQFYRESV